MPIRIALSIFCRQIITPATASFRAEGPLLIAANHPNSFLDAIIIGSQFSHPVHFLARGDAFRKPWHNTLLRLLNMIPVYRMSEGKDNLHRNADAFQQCREVLAKDGIVLIFIEGISVNSHQLQPFKKGAARIAIENRHLQHFRILPLGIAYDSLVRFGKTVCIETGKQVPVNALLPYDDEAKNMRHFNEQLFDAILPLIQVPQKETSKGVPAKWLLLLPALIGATLHFPLYSGLKMLVQRQTKGTIFYDSVLFGALFLVYPLYLLLLCLLLVFLNQSFGVLVCCFLIHPFTAYATVRFLKQRTA